MTVDQETREFRGLRAILEREITIDAAPDTVFPLLCPVREGEWLPGWKGKPIFASRGVAEENGVFATEHPGQEETIWFVTRHDVTAREIEFVYFIPRVQVVRLFIRVVPSDRHRARIAVRYIRTGISDDGNAVIRRADAEFGPMMAEWERTLNHYLKTGHTLPERR